MGLAQMPEYPIHAEIMPHVHMIRGANKSRFPEANALLIDDEVMTLVDAGPNMNHILKTLSDLGHSVRDLDRIILTHFHIDHKGHAAQLQKASGCEIICHPLAEKGISTFQGMVECYGIEGNRRFSGWMSTITTWVPHITSDCPVSSHFIDGKPIDCGETRLLPLHTPGHTSDHTCFGINDYNTILLVDIDLTSFGPWYGNVVSDLDQFESSIKKVMNLSPKMGISGHLLEPVTEELQGRLAEFLAVFDERDRRILELVDRGHDTLEKLTSLPTIYPRIPNDLFYIFEEFMLKKHIDRLTERGLLTETDGYLKVKR
ncbi:MAG: hypothetical protein C4K49_07495 [Candidatus Thorarchaeota archaeon]|nr:MAG: hypothetical protein C4K49_07495 [Candidatus Thorarchaeota archaeon]